MGASRAFGVETCLREGHRRGAVHQPAACRRAGRAPGRMKLVFISIVTTPDVSAMPSTLRARRMRHGDVEQRHRTPPCATPQRVDVLGAQRRSAISDSPPSKRTQLEAEMLDEGDVDAGISSRVRAQAGDDAVTPPSTASHWPVMCLPASRREQQRRALQVFVVAEAPQRRVAGQLVLADALERALGHLAREEARASALTLMPYLPHSPASVRVKFDDRALGGVVGEGLHLGAGCRARPAIEAMLMMRPLFLGIMLCLPTAWLNRKIAAHVEVHHLVPGLDRMVLGRRAPGGAGVVDQDVDLRPCAPASRRPGARTISLAGSQSAAIQRASMPAACSCGGGLLEVARPCAR